MATIKDVARLVGVSPSTVSRVLSGHPAISQETRERVLKVLADLNYHPNAPARSLVRRRTRVIALAIDRPAGSALANPFFPEILRGIGDGAYEQGYDVLLVTSKTATEEEEHCLRLLRTRKVDGVILSTPRAEDRLVRTLVQEGWPAVLVGRPEGATPVSWINNDNLGDARRITEHLLQLGHRRIGFLGGPETFLVSRDRREGYRQALQAAGIPPRPETWEVVTDFSQEDGYRGMASLREKDPSLTAAVAIDDQVALGALRWLEEAGVAVPGAFSLVGFNDDPMARLVRPALTTVSLPVYEMGRLAAEHLIQHIETGASVVEGTVVRTQLLVRESSGPAPT